MVIYFAVLRNWIIICSFLKIPWCEFQNYWMDKRYLSDITCHLLIPVRNYHITKSLAQLIICHFLVRWDIIILDSVWFITTVVILCWKSTFWRNNFLFEICFSSTPLSSIPLWNDIILYWENKSSSHLSLEGLMASFHPNIFDEYFGGWSGRP